MVVSAVGDLELDATLEVGIVWIGRAKWHVLTVEDAILYNLSNHAVEFLYKMLAFRHYIRQVNAVNGEIL